jgi:hypothetical protein
MKRREGRPTASARQSVSRAISIPSRSLRSLRSRSLGNRSLGNRSLGNRSL